MGKQVFDDSLLPIANVNMEVTRDIRFSEMGNFNTRNLLSKTKVIK